METTWQERLRSAYGVAASITTERLAPGFAVTIELPLVNGHTPGLQAA